MYGIILIRFVMNIVKHVNDIDIKYIPLSCKSVAIDTETMGLLPHRDKLCVIQMSFGGDDVHIIQTKDYDMSVNIKKILTNSSITKIFHYARFDMMMLYHYLGVMPENIYCTKIVSKLCRTYTSAHGLNAICQELLGHNLSKSETHTNWGADELTVKQLEYAALDVYYLHDIKDKLDQMLMSNGRTEIAQRCFEFLPTRCLLDIMVGDTYDIFAHH